jgi:DNA mismatch repair protein MutH
MNMPYDITSPGSILDYAKRLSGRTLSEAVDMTGVAENTKNKGNLGSLVEKYYFQHVPPNDHKPDFAEAGVELKTTGVRRTSDGAYKAKERLVLTLINYMTLVDEEWSESSLMNKCRLMLLLFYLYQRGLPVVNRRFILEPLLWEFPDADLKVIRRDWEYIQQKIREGKAHELSEGDTFYLGACRKGAGGEKEPMKQQPFSSLSAPSRAFSLKPSYINTILSNHTQEADIFDSEQAIRMGLEDATLERFRPYIGMTVEDIGDALVVEKNGIDDKGFYRRLTMKVFGTTGNTVPELEKAGVELKVMRLRHDGVPKESMSFPAFSYLDIVEEEWEDSVFCEKIEKKFLFVIFKFDAGGNLRLHKVMYWNMPYEDREEARVVWEMTKSRIADGREDKLPKISDSYVAHVRPHAKNAQDVLPTPSGRMLVKKGFWLNQKYLADQISSGDGLTVV